MKKVLLGAVATASAVVVLAGPAFAHQCTNASKNEHARPGAGAQLIIGDGDELLYISKGLENRIEQGIVDFETGEGFHGQVGFQEGDQIVTTYIVGPNGEIPQQAQFNGPDDRGIVNICGPEGCGDE